MERFYTGVLGFTVMDRGQTVGFDLVFLSRDPADHHQLVLSTGRPEHIPANTANPSFGPVINQISFRLASLGDLKDAANFVRRVYSRELLCLDHGAAWSVYFDDPEGNKIELFVDSDWYIKQPVAEPFDIDLAEDEIFAATETRCRTDLSFCLAAEWRERIRPKMAADRVRVA